MTTMLIRLLKGLFLSLVILVLIGGASIAGLIFWGVTIDLGFFTSGVERSAGSVLEREVSIGGPVTLEFSTWPALDIQGLEIANTASSSSPLLLSAGRARVQLGIVPLFKGTIEIAELIAEDIVLNLEHNKEGVANWELGPEAVEPSIADPQSETHPGSDDKRPPLSFNGIHKLRLDNINLNYRDAALDKTYEFRLDQMQGEAPPGKPVEITFAGLVQDYSYDLRFNGDSLEQLQSFADHAWGYSLQGEVVGKQVAVSGNLMSPGGEPQANLSFAIDDIDVGLVLDHLGLIEDLEASTGSMGFNLALKGGSLNEIVQQSSLSFKVRDGRWRINSPTSEAFIDVTELNGDIFVEEGNAVTMKLAGMAGELPVDFVITGAPLVDYVVDQKSIPLTVEARFANNTLGFGGELMLPVSSRELSLFMTFKSDNLQNLEDLLAVELPSLGPIDFGTTLKVSENRYEMDKLDIQVGGSLLSGKMSFDPSKPIPEAKIKLVSELLQLDDFQGIVQVLPDSDHAAQETAEESDQKKKKTSNADTSEKRRNLLSHEVLNSFNAELLIKAQEVLSGEDRLGSAILEMNIEEGLLAVDPLHVEVPGGGVQARFDYQPDSDSITFNLDAEIEEFDIGVLVRRSKPESDMGGLLFLDTSLHSVAPDVHTIMEHARGHFDFGLVPKNFSAGIVDLWAVNLISAIMKEVSEQEKSVINCVVVRLGVEEGLMTEKALYMDTSNMRIAGNADVDFKTRRLKVLMVPKAKKPEFFSLAVPIRIEGSFDDFGLGIGLARLTGAVISFITSPLHVPIRRVFANEIPEDGKEACLKAWALTEETTSTVQ